ncbi:hypothetical protein [Mucilaginibacter ginsenosidivorans]|uniref:Glycosyltransferase RgtA/B/C/D-like domain-containing protein n=1 Tax=Mucilaginibacter ginsenosidivorans TaxID=398053 RepID=A0A5B8UW71_9SPHI|nr:hypothetical protein [Mucilaginibacter ginsenosidivorans]QEC62581.1 hypothetical protein FRZ54_08255 [Mucilaginibacter ginsenosidivorans]
MITAYQNLPKAIMAFLYLAVIVLGIMIFIAPPSIFPDPANGFRVMRSMQLGGGFNRLITPDADNLTKNTSEFLTWWSPGQYLVPYTFKLLIGVNTGQASALTITLCQLLGLGGFYAFFKKIGFSPLISSLSLLFIACQQFFVVPYVFYNGGEILLFAFLGWFLYGCTAINTVGWQLTLFVLLAGWIGFFCKSSVVWMYAAGLLFLWMRLSSLRPSAEWIRNAVWIGLPAIVSMVSIWLFFLSKGQNPASVSAGVKLSLKAIFFPLASPILSGFSVDDLSHGLIYHTGKAIFSNTEAIILLALLAFLSLWLIQGVVRAVPDKNYKLLVRVFYIASVIFFCIAYLRQMTISYEARHFRIIGLIVVPGVLYLLSKVKLPVYRVAFGLIWAGIAVSSVIYIVKGYSFNGTKSARGFSGIAQQAIDQKALNEVIALDKKNRDAIFVFVNESLGLEIRHNRVVTLNPIGDDLRIDYDDYEQGGHAGPLYIILPESYAGPKEKFILKSFPDYKGWYGSMLSDNYVMYEAK